MCLLRVGLTGLPPATVERLEAALPGVRAVRTGEAEREGDEREGEAPASDHVCENATDTPLASLSPLRDDDVVALLWLDCEASLC